MPDTTERRGDAAGRRLQRCPFCGDSGAYVDQAPSFDQAHEWYVQCKNRECNASTGLWATPAEAARRWNHRARWSAQIRPAPRTLKGGT